MEFTKIKNFCSLKFTCEENKEGNTGRKYVQVMYLTKKRLVPRIYKEHTK